MQLALTLIENRKPYAHFLKYLEKLEDFCFPLFLDINLNHIELEVQGNKYALRH